MIPSKTNVDLTNPVVLLMIGLVMTVTLAISATGWTVGMNVVIFVGVGSIIVSLMLVRSILPGLVTHQMSLIIGLGWSFWVTSRLLPENYTWMERWENLIARLQYWYHQAMQGGTSYDNLMFLFQMNVILWGMGYMMIWLLLRTGRVWLALVPGGIVMLINLHYAPNDISLWFFLYLLLALLLVIQVNLSYQEARWRAEGVFFRPEVRFDVLRDGFIFSTLVILIAWWTPPLVNASTLPILNEFQGRWQDVQREWNRLYADLNYRDTAAMDAFGTSLTLGGPRNLTDDPVMDVAVQGLGRYWRATIYNEYDGDGWRNTLAESGAFDPETPLDLPFFESRYLVTQTYTLYRDNSTVLYAMAHPLWLDRSALVNFTPVPTELAAQRTAPPIWYTGNPQFDEITYIRSNAAVNQGESYQVVSLATQASIQQLQATGSDYPEWITERYLQLPDSVTQRTRDLAARLTASADNNFDKARAIEEFLRGELTYNERMSQPPPNVDKVDYVLFEGKEAYCDYYASSMIVMLRSIGIPARFAVGFARGQYDSDKQAFHVINADAHSWVEVYFPRYGWLEFEPTAAQPIIIRPTAEEESNLTAPNQTPLQPFPERDEFPDREENIPVDEPIAQQDDTPFIQFTLPWMGQPVGVSGTAVLGSGVVLIGLLMLLLVALLLIWRGRQPQAESIGQLYRRLLRLAAWMGYTIQPTQTPYEHAAVLERHLPFVKTDINLITTEYVQHTFAEGTTASTAAGATSTYESRLAWGRLRPAMLASIGRRLLRRG